MSDRPDRPQLLGELKQLIAATVHEPALLQTYNFAINELQTALALYSEPGSSSRDILDAMIWLFRVSGDLVPLLKVPTQEAVAIFAHYGLLLKRHEREWWLQGWGDHLISRAYELLDEEHKGWIPWPMTEMGWIPS